MQATHVSYCSLGTFLCIGYLEVGKNPAIPVTVTLELVRKTERRKEMLQEELNIVNFILFKFTNKAPIDSFVFKRLPLTMQELV
jgi:hypothetical protein